jgi:hypothetical protein
VTLQNIRYFNKLKSQFKNENSKLKSSLFIIVNYFLLIISSQTGVFSKNVEIILFISRLKLGIIGNQSVRKRATVACRKTGGPLSSDFKRKEMMN